MFKSTKILELGSCAFRQPNAAFNRPNAGDNACRCSKLHGYKLIAKFWFACERLDDKNWVADFGGFGPIKEQFKHQFDHTTCLSFDDPLLEEFKKIEALGGLDLRIMPKGTGIERIAEWCFEMMNNFIVRETDGRVWLESVEVFEHENNSAIFTKPQDAVLYVPPQYTEVSLPTSITPLVKIGESVDVPAAQIRTPAPVGRRSTSGMGDLFEGTMFGR